MDALGFCCYPFITAGVPTNGCLETSWQTAYDTNTLPVLELLTEPPLELYSLNSSLAKVSKTTSWRLLYMITTNIGPWGLALETLKHTGTPQQTHPPLLPINWSSVGSGVLLSAIPVVLSGRSGEARPRWMTITKWKSFIGLTFKSPWKTVKAKARKRQLEKIKQESFVKVNYIWKKTTYDYSIFCLFIYCGVWWRMNGSGDWFNFTASTQKEHL